jgi:predicted nucleotidyltransferase
MSLFRRLNLAAAKENADFLVIGGMAVIFYGYSRETADLDILVSAVDRELWLKTMANLGYELQVDGGMFLQFLTVYNHDWPVDFMLVKEATFAPMAQAAREVSMLGEKVKIPSLEHLLALKLHALKHGNPRRFIKDYLDVENLISINKLNIKAEKVKTLFEKYGTMELYEKVSRSLQSE